MKKRINEKRKMKRMGKWKKEADEEATSAAASEERERTCFATLHLSTSKEACVCKACTLHEEECKSRFCGFVLVFEWVCVGICWFV